MHFLKYGSLLAELNWGGAHSVIKLSVRVDKRGREKCEMIDWRCLTYQKYVREIWNLNKYNKVANSNSNSSSVQTSVKSLSKTENENSLKSANASLMNSKSKEDKSPLWGQLFSEEREGWLHECEYFVQEIFID